MNLLSKISDDKAVKSKFSVICESLVKLLQTGKRNNVLDTILGSNLYNHISMKRLENEQFVEPNIKKVIKSTQRKSSKNFSLFLSLLSFFSTQCLQKRKTFSKSFTEQTISLFKFLRILLSNRIYRRFSVLFLLDWNILMLFKFSPLDLADQNKLKFLLHYPIKEHSKKKYLGKVETEEIVHGKIALFQRILLRHFEDKLDPEVNISLLSFDKFQATVDLDFLITFFNSFSFEEIKKICILGNYVNEKYLELRFLNSKGVLIDFIGHEVLAAKNKVQNKYDNYYKFIPQKSVNAYQPRVFLNDLEFLKFYEKKLRTEVSNILRSLNLTNPYLAIPIDSVKRVKDLIEISYSFKEQIWNTLKEGDNVLLFRQNVKRSEVDFQGGVIASDPGIGTSKEGYQTRFFRMRTNISEPFDSSLCLLRVNTTLQILLNKLEAITEKQCEFVSGKNNSRYLKPEYSVQEFNKSELNPNYNVDFMAFSVSQNSESTVYEKYNIVQKKLLENNIAKLSETEVENKQVSLKKLSDFKLDPEQRVLIIGEKEKITGLEKVVEMSRTIFLIGSLRYAYEKKFEDLKQLKNNLLRQCEDFIDHIEEKKDPKKFKFDFTLAQKLQPEFDNTEIENMVMILGKYAPMSHNISLAYEELSDLHALQLIKDKERKRQFLLERYSNVVQVSERNATIAVYRSHFDSVIWNGVRELSEDDLGFLEILFSRNQQQLTLVLCDKLEKDTDVVSISLKIILSKIKGRCWGFGHKISFLSCLEPNLVYQLRFLKGFLNYLILTGYPVDKIKFLSESSTFLDVLKMIFEAVQEWKEDCFLLLDSKNVSSEIKGKLRDCFFIFVNAENIFDANFMKQTKLFSNATGGIVLNFHSKEVDTNLQLVLGDVYAKKLLTPKTNKLVSYENSKEVVTAFLNFR
eukprot:snap_masked-scaffold_43-processed-gene-0.24-mRNA-1 protein AED:1.00 eAED:1.00 QI:0/-1/0/0/-1/1/1/0/911